MSTIDENVALCALNRIFGYHPRLALRLMEQAGSAAALFAGGPVPDCPEHPELAAQLEPSALDWAARELEKVQAGGFRFLSLAGDDYPDELRQCPDPPLGLYLNGSSSPAELFSLRPVVAFVGTRDASPYGRAWCRKLVEALSRAPVQPCIVSGLALGIDGIAHQTALECGLPTLGVMATGIEKVYPWQHERLAMSMVRTPGSGLLTDYPLDTSPVALNFLRRNRIIAGLARAVVVVESKTQGGSLMTAKYAVAYNRDVFAVPGRLDDVRSAGCNSLICEQMAQIITGPEQLVDSLGLGGRTHRGAGGSWRSSLPGDPPERVLQAQLARRYGPGALQVAAGLAIQARRGITAEELAASLERPFAEVLSAASRLEADGVVVSDLLRRYSLAPEYDR